MNRNQVQQRIREINLEEINKILKNIKDKRDGQCPNGKTWNRTPYESLSKRGLWAACFFVSEFNLIIAKRSTLTKTEAKFIKKVCAEAIALTSIRYHNEKVPQKKY